jgi:hypothetical protein
MVDDLLHRLSAVALAVFQLQADFAQRPALPSHLDWGEVPVLVTGNTRSVKVFAVVARRALHSDRAMTTFAACHRRLVNLHLVAL